MSEPQLEAPLVEGSASPAWLNRAVWGMAATSFLADLGHEAQSTLLPSFMSALGLPPAALGVVEGVADAAASFVKLGAGWFSDRLGIRKPFVVAGYLMTGLASGFIALAHGLPLILGGKVFGWLGRGVRGPLAVEKRDAVLKWNRTTWGPRSSGCETGSTPDDLGLIDSSQTMFRSALPPADLAPVPFVEGRPLWRPRLK